LGGNVIVFRDYAINVVEILPPLGLGDLEVHGLAEADAIYQDEVMPVLTQTVRTETNIKLLVEHGVLEVTVDNVHVVHLLGVGQSVRLP
jgi:hypothetical protein